MDNQFYNIRRLALIFAVQAEIDGMKAENRHRIMNDEANAYGYDHFKEKAEELRSLAYAHNEQL